MIKCEQPRLMAEIGHILKHGKTTKEADHSLFGKFTISSLSTKPTTLTSLTQINLKGSYSLSILIQITCLWIYKGV